MNKPTCSLYEHEPEVQKLLQVVKADLTRHEGVVLRAYQCSEGVWTIGVGHRILPGEVGRYMHEVITVDEAMAVFERDVCESYITAWDFSYGEFANLPFTIQRVLVNMAFQLGRTRLGGFKKMRAAVARRDWRDMIREMKDSKWYRQTTNRAVEEIGWIKEMLSG